VDKVTLALLLIGVVHVLGAVLLFALLFDAGDVHRWWPRDDRRDDPPPADDGPPLPSADPADMRLRDEHDRLGRRRLRVRGPAGPERAPGREREPAA
jgi:hypothetical protein